MPPKTTISEPLVEFIGGRRYFSWEVIQKEMLGATHALIEDVPTFCTLTLYEMQSGVIHDPATAMIDA